MTDVKALEKELKDEFNLDPNIFFNVEELERKRLLGEEYDDVRAKHQWIYDQPISEDAEKKRKAALEQEKKDFEAAKTAMKESEKEQREQREERKKERKEAAEVAREARKESEESAKTPATSNQQATAKPTVNR
jgi:hypothetical protein